MEIPLSGRLDPLVWRRGQRLTSIAAAGAAAAVLALSTLLAAPIIPFKTCIFRIITGWPCPSCGMTHAFIALGHGRLKEAILLNIMSPLLFAVLVGILAISIYEALGGRLVLQPLWARAKGRLLPVILILAGLSWAWNIFKHLGHPAF